MSSSSKILLCKPFLINLCGVSEDTLRTRLRLDRIKVFTESDRGYTGDNRYDPPVGWCYTPINDRVNYVPSEYDICFHGTPPRFIKSILKDRLVKPGNKTSEGRTITVRPGHIKDKNFIYTSPSIHYASHFVYAEPVKWEYQGKTYYVRSVFQVRQKHDSYLIQRNTLHESCWDPTVSFDDHFKNEELEWYTEDQHSIILAGLLLHFSETPVRDLIKRRQDERKRSGARPETSLAADREEFQRNLMVTKKKILWVDDHPGNNKDLVDIIRGSRVECITCLDTEDGIRKLRENQADIFAIITDLVRNEKRSTDSEKRDHYEAGIDFIREAKRIGATQPIYMYSSYCRQHRNLIERTLEAGATKVCTHEDVNFIIRKEI